MDQVVAIKLIEQDILNQHGRHWLTATSIRPAWKYAFYNPAKRKSDGSIVIKRDNIMLIVYAILILFFSILFVVDGIYNWLYISTLAFAVLSIVKYYYYDKAIIVNATGITFNSHTYHWRDYSGAFISQTWLHKYPKAHLILVDSAYRITSIDITNMGKLNAIGTAIRDFQPVGWKP
jgi:hypothetical protein